MSRKSHNLFLHILNLDTQEIFGFPKKMNNTFLYQLKKCLNASVLLCDVDTYCIVPAGFWFESEYTRELLKQHKEYLERGFIRIALRDETIEEFIAKKQEKYKYFRSQGHGENYKNFYEEEVFRELMKINVCYIERDGKVGKACMDLWNQLHIDYLEENKGELASIYKLIDDKDLSKKVATVVMRTAEDPGRAFVWDSVTEAIKNAGLYDSEVEIKLRRIFEKGYYEFYEKVYDARLLLDAYLVDRNITFGIAFQSDSISRYSWFEHFLAYNGISEILGAPAWKIELIKDQCWWKILDKYIEVCNLYDTNYKFEASCAQLDARNDIEFKNTVLRVKEIMKMEKKIDMDIDMDEASITSDVDVLIMVATQDEQKAILSEGGWESAKTYDRYEYFVKTEGLKFALARAGGMGPDRAAQAAQFYHDRIKSKYMAMAGFCAGRKGKVELGDVIVPYKMIKYGEGAQTGELSLEKDLDVFNLNDLWKQKAENMGNEWRSTIKIEQPHSYKYQLYYFIKVLRDNSWKVSIELLNNDINIPDYQELIIQEEKEGNVSFIKTFIKATAKGRDRYQRAYMLEYKTKNEQYFDPEPKLRVAVMATGQVVQKWDKAFEKLGEEYDRKIYALDMEATSVANVGFVNNIDCLIAKGVGDFGSTTKTFDNHYMNYAIRSSYRFIVAFFNSLMDE